MKWQLSEARLTVVAALVPLSPTPTAMKTPENTEEDPDEPQPAEGDIQV